MIELRIRCYNTTRLGQLTSFCCEIIHFGLLLRAAAEQLGPIPLVKDSQHHNAEPSDPQ